MLVKLIFSLIIALLLLLSACGAFYLSQQKPLPYWVRNGFLRWINAPEILDRIQLIIIGLGLVALAVIMVLAGAGILK